ncbi:MAG: carboxypeptidase regulatory-like domain-containing protein [Chloroflexus sp.]
MNKPANPFTYSRHRWVISLITVMMLILMLVSNGSVQATEGETDPDPPTETSTSVSVPPDLLGYPQSVGIAGIPQTAYVRFLRTDLGNVFATYCINDASSYALDWGLIDSNGNITGNMYREYGALNGCQMGVLFFVGVTDGMHLYVTITARGSATTVTRFDLYPTPTNLLNQCSVQTDSLSPLVRDPRYRWDTAAGIACAFVAPVAVGWVPPAAPGNLVLTGVTKNSVSVTWQDNSDNEDGFKLYRWDGSAWVVHGTVGANVTSYTYESLTCNTQYYFNVNAYNAYGETPAPSSGWLIVTTGACDPPPTYAISGYVRTGSGAPLAGVTVAIGTRSAITDGNGYYALSGVPAGNYTLTPTLNGYSFNPSNRTVTVNGNLSNQDFTAEPGRPVPPPPPAPPPSTGWRVPFFTQLDWRWGSQRMPNCNDTIANIGCALTSLAMLLNSYGASTDPGTLNRCLGSTVACPLYWGHPNVRACSGNRVSFKEWPSFSYAKLESALRDGPVILELLNRSTRNMHFVVVFSGSGSNPDNYVAHDPGRLNGANKPLSEVLGYWQRSMGLEPNDLRLYSGIPTPASLSSELQAELPPLDAPAPAAGEVVSGAAALYDAGSGSDTIILELSAQSSASSVTEMRVWTSVQSSDYWQPFSPYVEVPMHERIFLQFRDALGNTSPIIEANVPVPDSIVSASQTALFLPLVVR